MRAPPAWRRFMAMGGAMIGTGRIADLLGDADYRRIWTAGMASGVSRWLEMLAVGIYAFETTGSPFLVAFLVIARLLPLAVLGLVVGTLADRLSPRRFLVVGMLVGLIVSGTVALLFLLGRAGYSVVVVSAVASGVVWSLDMPLRRRMIGDLAGRERLVTALSFDSATNHSTRAIGPFLGGVLYEAFGPTGAFALTASCYAIALLNVVRVGTGGGSPAGAAAPTRIAADFREAVSFAVTDKDVLRILLVTVVFNVFALPFLAMIPVLGSDTLQLGAGWIGALAGIEGMGAFLGSLAIAMANPKTGLRRFYYFGVFAYVVFAFLAGWMTAALPMAAVVLAIGLATAGFSSMQSTLAYSVAPPHMRSRLLGLIVICIGTGVFGVANMGFLAEWFGAPAAVSIVAVEGMIALLAIGLGWRELWNRQHA